VSTSDYDNPCQVLELLGVHARLSDSRELESPWAAFPRRPWRIGPFIGDAGAHDARCVAQARTGGQSW
jgi:hypothetical protein